MQESKNFSGIKTFYRNVDNDGSFRNIECLILSMPFVESDNPTVGVAVLKSALNAANIKADVHYPGIPFSSSLPKGMYRWFGSNIYERIGDYAFSEVLFGHDEAREKKMIEAIYNLNKNSRFPKGIEGIDNVKDLLEFLPQLNSAVFALITEITELIRVRKNIKIVCCSATFVQLFASLAVLKEIKAVRPDVFTVIGGCECEGEAAKEIVKEFDFIDYSCSGEGDITLPQLCSNLLNDRNNENIQLPVGVYDRNKAFNPSSESAIVVGDKIYSADHNRFYLEQKYIACEKKSDDYTIEFSRGCWKGYKSHCTFCGLNGLRMKYRLRNTDEVISEIKKAYEGGKRVFYVVDSVLDLNHMKPIFGYIRHHCPEAIFMCDTVSSLSFQHMKNLADSGMLIITAGIESLHPKHLVLMNKGPRAIANIAYLKYASINHMHILWNMLTAIPGDAPHDYDELAEIIPLLEHLTPPNYSVIRFDRHSVYWESPSKYGLNLVPMRNVEYLIPRQSKLDLERFSMYFDNLNDSAVTPYDNESLQNLFATIDKWQAAKSNGASLKITDKYIIDTRTEAVCERYRLSDNDTFILNYLFSPRSFEDTNRLITQNQLEENLKKLLDNKYIIKWDNAYLSLVVPEISNFRIEAIRKRWECSKIDLNG